MDTMMTFNNQNLAENFMSEEEIRKVCPHAYDIAPTNPNVSGRYVQANTSTVISDMEKLGWGVVDAKQRKERSTTGGVYSFHMIAFQNPNLKIMKTNPDGEKVVECYPRIILTNSHDGMNSFKFMVGLFRLVCSNGLVVASDKFVDIRIRHINYNFEELRSVLNTAVDELPNHIKVINKMKDTELSNDEKIALAVQMLKIRKDLKESDELKVDDETIEDMLTPMRDEDNGNDLWSVFNVLQEKVIKGGFHASINGKKARKMRSVKSFAKDLNYNKKMFQTALSYVPMAA